MPGKLSDFSPLTSFRRRPESSGLDNPFPHSGNDNHRNDNRTCYPAKPAIHSLPWPLFLDSSLRWNDDGGGNGFVAIPTASLLFLANYLTSTSPVIPAKAGIQWFRQAIPRIAGMTTGTTTEHAVRQNLPSLHHPGLPSWIPAFAGMTTGVRMGLLLSR